jgi:hypothetical protein
LLLEDDVKRRVWFEQGHLVRENFQPTRIAELKAIQQRRDNPGSVKDLGFGRAALTIPQHDYMRLTKANPDLISPDAEIKTKAWQRFWRTSESRIYRNFSVI